MRRPLPEPWRVKVVEKIHLLPREERERLLVEGGFSLFGIPSEAVFIDMFTDSGTSAMSDWQWAGVMQGEVPSGWSLVGAAVILLGTIGNGLRAVRRVGERSEA